VTGRRAVAVGVIAGAAAALAWARRRYLLVTVVGRSMAPAYHDGQRLLVRRGRYAVGDVVMFRAPGPVQFSVPWLVKRVAALPGDSIPPDIATACGPGTVPPGRLVVLSDAPDGLDSRQLGFIDSQDVTGKVCWPGRPRTDHPA
jgi:signal peptidase I